MRSRRVPVLRLGSRGPGGDAKSLRLWPQPSAIVHKHPRRAGHAGETKIAAKRRTVTFYVSYYDSVNCHRDRGGRGRETQNCRHFWTRLASSRLKSVNCHRDRGGRGRETQICRHFWTRRASSRLKSVNCHKDRGGRGRETNAELSSLLDSSCVFASQKCQLSQGPGGSWSRNADLSSLLDSSCVFASQKCQRSQGARGSWSRNPALSSLLDSSSETGTGGEKRVTRGEEREAYGSHALSILECRPWGAV